MSESISEPVFESAPPFVVQLMEGNAALACPILYLLTLPYGCPPDDCTPDECTSLHPRLTGPNALLLQQLLNLGVSAYEELISQLLRALGYERVRALRDPTRQRHSHKGRNSHGGVDIIAQSRSGLSADAVLVQVKQYQRPVSRRFVDELRGALLRTQSRHALLITTSRFSPAAIKAAQEDHIAPVHLMDGDSLCDLLIQHQIGVRNDKRSDKRHDVQIDHDFFRRLRKRHPTVSTRKVMASLIHNADANGKNLVTTKEPSTMPVGTRLGGARMEKGGGMMGRTHALFGIATLWLFRPFDVITQDNLAPLILIAMLGALFPDLDASESKLKRFTVIGIAPFAPLSQVLHQTFGHRGLLHSLAGLGFFSLLCALPLALWLGWLFGIMLALGYASHLLADSATKSGVPLLYPRRRRYHLLPRGWRFTTGSMAEEMLLPFLALAILLLLFSQLSYIS